MYAQTQLLGHSDIQVEYNNIILTGGPTAGVSALYLQLTNQHYKLYKAW